MGSRIDDEYNGRRILFARCHHLNNNNDVADGVKIIIFMNKKYSHSNSTGLLETASSFLLKIKSAVIHPNTVE